MAIEGVMISTEEVVAVHQGAMSGAVTEIEIERLIALGATEIGPGTVATGDFPNSNFRQLPKSSTRILFH